MDPSYNSHRPTSLTDTRSRAHFTPSLQQVEACNTDTTPTQPHRNSNTHRTKNNTTYVVIQQNSRKLLMIDILVSEICWAHKKWNKIASDIKLVFYSSTITLMHGSINIRFKKGSSYSQRLGHTDVQFTTQFVRMTEEFQYHTYLVRPWSVGLGEPHYD